MRGKLKVIAVKAPDFGENRKAKLQDITELTGGTFFSEELGRKLETFKVEDLGIANKVVVTKDETTIIVDDKTKKERVEEYLINLKARLERCSNEFEADKLRERISKLSGGVAVIEVGGITEVEMKEKKLRIEDALNATKAAVKEGIVAGGGTALLKASKEVEKLLKGEKMKKDVRTGVDIVLKALSAPIMQIAENAGEAGAVIADKVSSNKNSNFGYDALEGRFVDMIEQGIIDPVKVTKSALTNAASVASMILTSEAAVIELPKKEGLQLNTDVGSMYL